MGKRGNGVGCVESGASGTGDAASDFLAKAKARAALAKTVKKGLVPSPATPVTPTLRSPAEAATPTNTPADASPKKIQPKTQADAKGPAALAATPSKPTGAREAPTSAGKAKALATPKSCLEISMFRHKPCSHVAQRYMFTTITISKDPYQKPAAKENPGRWQAASIQ